MDNYSTRDAWAHKDAVIRLLGQQLAKGRLALFLGAGVSAPYGLPNWIELVNRMCALKGVAPLGAGEDPTQKIEALRLKHYKRNASGYLADVRSALYGDRSIDFDELRKIELLSAIGALAMASRRGSTSKIITLNFDDLLELYLEFHGFVVESIHSDRHWASAADVTILHPHGLVPLAKDRTASREIVFGTTDYLQITGDTSLWRPALQTILRSHTTIYIGLSGSDQHQQRLVADLRGSHAYKTSRHSYHGIRFDTQADTDIEALMDDFGVKTQILGNWQELPGFLFSVCQEARRTLHSPR